MQQVLTKQQAVELAKTFVSEKLPKLKWYRLTERHVKAIVLYGSSAKGLNRPDSDVDLLIFMPLAIEEQYTTGEYFYQFQGREINVVIRSIERLRIIAKEHSDSFQQEVFRASEVIWAADAEVAELIRSLTSTDRG